MTDVAAQGASLLDWVTGLVTDPVARSRFAADPHGVLGEQGLADLDPADLHHAIPLVTDTVAARLDTVADGSSAVPDLLDGESGLEAAVRQITAIPDRIVLLDGHDHPPSDLDDGGRGPRHDVPVGFDDPVGHPSHEGLDDPAPGEGDHAAHVARIAGENRPPATGFATGEHDPAAGGGADEPAGHDDRHDAGWHDAGWHEPEVGPHPGHDPTDGDHRLDQHEPDEHEHDIQHDTHHDPGTALGAS